MSGSLRSFARRALVALALLFAPVAAPRAAWAEGVADLPTAVRVRVVKSAEQELARVERVLKAQRDVDAAVVQNITLKLQNMIEDQLGDGPVVLYPRAVFTACLTSLRGGASKDQIAAQLVEHQRSGRFERMANGQELRRSRGRAQRW